MRESTKMLDNKVKELEKTLDNWEIDEKYILPTSEEVCRLLELISMFDDTNSLEGMSSLVYIFTHIRRENKCDCTQKGFHKDWVKIFRKHQVYWENMNKAPKDPTKVQDMEYPE